MKISKKEYYETNYNIDEIEEDPRFKVCAKEMKITFGIQLIYTVITMTAAYVIGKGDPKDYTYIMGMPAWWFAVMVICLIFLGIIIFVTNKVFVNMDLHDEVETHDKRSA